MRRSIAVLLVCLAPASAHASPGPDSVVVIANADVPESVALAERYVRERGVPRAQLCLLPLPEADTISLAEYEAGLLEPLRACLEAGGVRARIEAALLIRGVPLRVNIPVGAAEQVVSTAAALSLWDSVMTDGGPVLGQPPGRSADCGASMCLTATWRNPYLRGLAFEPGFEVEDRGVIWRPILVTMLHARTYADAERLLDSALEGEAMAPPSGEYLFMEGRDPARGALDIQYDGVIGQLEARGFTATRVPFEADLTGRTLAAFFTGTATLGETIEGNTYLPGSVVDNLTSFGAVPRNFEETGESQVSIARWVEQGVAGVHGTVAEPLNNCFPSRDLLVSYVDGATLAEAFHGQLPFVYWRNLVLGDPMAAPHALRPELTVEGVTEGARLDGAVTLTVDATDPGARGVASIVAYLDGVEVARADGDRLEHCLAVPEGEDHHLLVVARAAEDPTLARPYQPKGWRSLTFDSAGGATECGVDVDAGPVVDGSISADAGASADGGLSGADAGCSCRVTPRGPRSPIALLALAGLLLLRARDRRR